MDGLEGSRTKSIAVADPDVTDLFRAKQEKTFISSGEKAYGLYRCKFCSIHATHGKDRFYQHFV